MGGAVANATTTIMTNISMEATQSTTSSCFSNIDQNQVISMSSGGDIILGNLTQSQYAVMDATCLASTDTSQSMQNDISNAIKAAVESQAELAIGQVAISEVDTIVATNLPITLLQEIINESIASVSQNQEVILESGGNIVVGDISQEQTAELTVEAIFENANMQKAMNKIATEADITAKATVKSFLTGIMAFGWMGVALVYGIPILIAVVIIAAIIGMTVSKFAKTGEGELSFINVMRTSLATTNVPRT